jgi:hypothetical protein
LKQSLLTAAVLATLGAWPLEAAAQAAPTQPSASSQLQPVSLPHLYWHFLIHQNELDVLAAQLTAQGQDGDALRNDFQTQLGFSDADYAPIRTSSQRLAAELAPIDAQLKALKGSPGSAGQAQALIAQLESYVNNEVYNLSIELPAQNKAALEQFMRQFFAPKSISATLPAASGSAAGQAVQP